MFARTCITHGVWVAVRARAHTSQVRGVYVRVCVYEREGERESVCVCVRGARVCQYVLIYVCECGWVSVVWACMYWCVCMCVRVCRE